MTITLMIECEAWRPARLGARLRRAVQATLADRGKTGSLTILLADDERLRALNAVFRKIDKSTNVLSFPAEDEGGYLGDLALGYGVTSREATEAANTLADHAVHLVVHGTLHLLGYDHIDPVEADAMEAIEIAILANLGIANPYVLSSSQQ